MKLIIVVYSLSLLAACTAPKPPQPSGDWMPVNHTLAKSGT
ncbi:hypothetical protein R75461_07292 [Paraburkholderia nemoris]|nr:MULTISPECIES: hypothetical protein [Paraburkholderia]CAE6847018.1 hypothetical protein R75461_07292 [Paraburkholderia nemoris]